MITRLTKIQLVIFAIVTLLGGAFVGGRYAKIDRMFVDRSFPVTVQLKDSGGLFEGSQVTYRGIGVGRVGEMKFKDNGVQARLDIENDAPKIPADILAVVANKSAVGEQFMDLQPRGSSAPYLQTGTHITEANTKIPIPVSELLLDVNGLVKSIDTADLKTVVNELGTALGGTGQDLGTIIDTTTEFIQAADDNIDSTRALIRDSSTVLQTQVDKGSQIQAFSKNLALLSDTLVVADPDLRRLVDGGAPAAKEVREVIAENAEDLTVLFNNLITVNRPAFENTQSVRALFILYPYLLEGAPSTIIENKDTGTWDASFGMVLSHEPAVCHKGYVDKRDAPQDLGGDYERFDTEADCTDDKLVPRNPSKTVIEKNRVAAAGYDRGRILSTTETDARTQAFGKDSWKWLLLGPTTTN